jgi:density-regulated protein
MTTALVEIDSETQSILPRRQVVYCGACGMPPEYCAYGPDYESHCLVWLIKNHPEMVPNEVEDPLEPWTLEQRLTAFYEKYVPDKVASVPSLLEKYAGKEEKLFHALVEKYGPEPDDPYDAVDDDDDEPMAAAGTIINKKTRRGASAKKTEEEEPIRIVIEKIAQKKKRSVTIVSGMQALKGVKLKDVAKVFSKKLAALTRKTK